MYPSSSKSSQTKIEKCTMCFNTINVSRTQSNDSLKLYSYCCKYLHSTIVNKNSPIVDFEIEQEREKLVPLCSVCCDSAYKLIYLAKQLELFQDNLSELVLMFSLGILNRRSLTSKRKSDNIFDFDASTLPDCSIFRRNSDQCNSNPNFPTEFSSANLQEEILSESKVVSFYDPVWLSTESQNEIPEDNINDVPEMKLAPGTNISIMDEDATANSNITSDTKAKLSYLNPQLPFKQQNRQKFQQIGSEKTVRHKSDSYTKKSTESISNRSTVRGKTNVTITVNSQHFETLDDVITLDDECETYNVVEASNLSTNILQPIIKSTKKKLKKGFHGHSDWHHNVNTQTQLYQCAICQKSFTRKSSYEQHQLIHATRIPHKVNFPEKNQNEILSLEDDSKNPTEQQSSNAGHLKSVSSTSFNAQSIVNVEDCSQSKHWCNLCPIYYLSAKTLAKHKRNVHENPFRCPTCDEVFPSHIKLRLHVRSHSSGQHRCDVCSFSYKNARALKAHQTYVHSNIRHFNCRDCGRGFKTHSDIKRHYKRIHFALEFSEDCVIRNEVD